MINSETKGNILLIAPLFFNYYQEIKNEAEILGYCVDYLCDTPSNTNFSKAVGRINQKLLNIKTQNYYQKKVLPIISNKSYDYVIVIAGMTFSFSSKIMADIRNRFKNAKFIIYQWDSEKNLPYVKSIHPFFNEIFSFDMEDCHRDNLYKFLPLFYTRHYEKIGYKNTMTFKYDCSYVGTAHPLKYKNINLIAKAIIDVYPNQFIYHYMPSELKYYYHKMLSPEYKNAKKSDFQWTKIPTEELLKIIEKSRCILDSPQADQTGLTIRAIECLGAKRKLITTNPEIKLYDFYNQRNILVFPDDIDLKSDFFSEPYFDIDQNIYQKYSLKSWINVIIGNK